MNLDERAIFRKHVALQLDDIRQIIQNIKKKDKHGFSKYEMVVPNSRLGIEVEVENALDIAPQVSNSGFSFWNSKEDHSLRNGGVEFVTCGGLYSKYIPYALADLFKFAMSGQEEFSDRTSIHIHCDMRRVPILKIISVLVLSIIFERVLYAIIERHGLSRTNNIFCTSISSNAVLIQYRQVFCDWVNGNEDDCWDGLRHMVHDWGKYSNINIIPLLNDQQGTIEYRMLHGTNDFNFVIQFIDMVLRMKVFSLRNSVREVFNTIVNLNTNSEYDLFAKSVFGENIYNNLLRQLNLQDLMETQVEELKSLYIAKFVGPGVFV